MGCTHQRVISPEEIGEKILEQLLAVAAKRNEAHPDGPAIYATIQTDIPGEIRIDVDYPTENQAIRNKYLAHLKIDAKTGEMTLTKAGSAPVSNIPCGNWVGVFEQMAGIISTS